MPLRDALERSLAKTFETINLLVADLSDADLLVRPVPGANHAAWQLGHLVLREHRLAEALGRDAGYGELPAGFAEAHSDAAAASDPPAGFLSKAEYLGLWAAANAATVAALRGLSDAGLDAPVKGDAARGPTVADAIINNNNQRGPHAGQLAVIRRVLGKPVVF